MGQEQCCTQDKPLQRQNKMATFPRSVSLAVFRAHIENGLSVAIGVGITGLGAGLALDFHSGIAAATGAVCVSISDRTDPLRQKIWIMGFAFLSACFFTALSSFSRFHPPVFIAAVAFTGLIARPASRAAMMPPIT